MCEHVLPKAQLELYAAVDFTPVQGRERPYLRYDGSNSSVHVKLLNKDVEKPVPVIIKAIRAEPVDEMEKATDNELKVWRLLDPNPNIARFLGTGQLDEWPFDHLSLVSEYYSSRDANKFLEENNISDDQRLQLLKGVLRGISYIHGKSIVHGDLKGANILVEDNGEIAKICDFGSSRISCGCYTGPDVQHGTYQWYSPERFETDAPTTQSDIWAFGCIVLEVQMDMVPYNDITYVGVVNRMSEEVPPATESYIDLDRPVQSAVWNIVQGCWEREPLKRPSAAELLLSFEGIN
ncbi:hypothetical protein FS749_004164 [Ceratobasidium sp. UAMH 11750]|nr:hypothetical protein FS749_004164 [Ceratobasidium sp. UAMH 11750]